MWDTSVPDWEKRLLAGRPLVPELPLFESERDKALRIFNRLKLPDVIGTPTMQEAAGDWFRDIVSVLFGSYDPETHERQIQEYFLLVPKKNGKSSYAAAIMVVAMIVNRRPNAEFLLIAPTKKIADIAFKQANDTIKLDPELAKLFHPQQHIRTITHRRSGASLQIKAADTDVITGSKSTGILVDETHEFAKKGNAAHIFTEIRGALAARPDGFMLQITTQSKDPPVGIFKSELALARDVRDGIVKLPRLAVLYELPERVAIDDGWKNEKFWPLVNPNMGRSVNQTWLRDELTAKERDGFEALALLASQHFNVEIGVALRNDAWAGSRYWEGAGDETITDFQAFLDRCEVVVVGADGGGLDDLFGGAFIGRDKVTRDWLVWAHAWCQPDVLERRKDIVSTLMDFKRDGDLTICDQPTQDLEEFADMIEMVRDAGLLPIENAIGLDQAGIASFVDELVSRGFAAGTQIVGVQQGYRLNGAILGMERKLKDGTLWHAGQPMMAWVIGNAKVEVRGSAVLITKQMAGRAKIDPFIAVLNAGMLMSRNPEAQAPSVYRERGMLVL
jgi:phage terminase large subunit-like protein